MRRIIELHRHKPMPSVILGIAGEHRVTEIAFDVSNYIEEFGEGHAELVVINPKLETYIQAVRREGSLVVWDVTRADTIVGGLGRAVLRWYTVDERLAKSVDIQVITIVSSDTGITGEMPDAVQDWLDAVEADKNDFVRIGVGIVADAKEQADRAFEEAERAKTVAGDVKQAVADAKETIRTDVAEKLSGAVQTIREKEESALHSIEEKSSEATQAVGTAKDSAVANVKSAEGASIGAINSAKGEAVTAVRAEVAQAAAEANMAEASAKEAKAYSESARTSASNAKDEADRAKAEADRAKDISDHITDDVYTKAQTDEKIGEVESRISESIADISAELNEYTTLGGNFFDKNHIKRFELAFNGTSVYTSRINVTIAIKLNANVERMYVVKPHLTSIFRCCVVKTDDVSISSTPYNYTSSASQYCLSLPIPSDAKWLLICLYDFNSDMGNISLDEIFDELVVSDRYYNGYVSNRVISLNPLNDAQENRSISEITVNELILFNDVSSINRLKTVGVDNVAKIIDNQLTVERDTSSSGYQLLYKDINEIEHKYLVCNGEYINVAFGCNSVSIMECYMLILDSEHKKAYLRRLTGKTAMAEIDSNSVRLFGDFNIVRFEKDGISIFSDYKYAGKIKYDFVNLPNQVGLFMRFAKTKVKAFGFAEFLNQDVWSMYDCYKGLEEKNSFIDSIKWNENGTEVTFTINKNYGESNVGSYRSEYSMKSSDGYSYHTKVSYDFKIDENMTASENYPYIIGQYHDATGWDIGLSPSVGIYCKNGRIYLVTHTNPYVYNGESSIAQNEKMYYIADIDYGNYHNLEMDIRFGCDGSLQPYVRVYYDGEIVLNITTPIGFNSSGGNYFKYGLYAWSWKNSGSPSLGKVSYKNLKLV